MCKSQVPLLALTLVMTITHHVGSFVFIEKGEPKGPIVQLFEWRFDDIAEECEQFLGPNGYSGVQVSPVTESVSLDGDPWHERYQPISYKIGSRSGNKGQFKDMIRRCTKSQIKVYVEVVVNHMTKDYAHKVYGTEDSYAFPAMYSYPEVPYLPEDFRTPCNLTDYNNATQVRECMLDGFLELDQSKHAVRCKISEFLNDLLDMGVAGFSFSHAKYMWPEDLKAIIGRLDYLSVYEGFGEFENPFVYQEFVEGGVVKPSEYYDLGLVTDFKYSSQLGQIFSGKKDLKELKNFGADESLIASERALVFIDNHLTQRGQGFEGAKSLSFKQAKRYTLANLFMLAWPHGQPRIMSGYEFEDAEQGPPRDKYGGIARVHPQDNGTCANGWTCEHRWLLINQMVKFRNFIQSLPVENWWDNGKNQIAFSRGDKGFVVFNLDSSDMNNVSIQTGLPPGSYCDMFSGYRTTGGECTGRKVVVGLSGKAKISLNASDEYGIIAVSQQDWLPYVPVSLTQQTDSEADQGSGSANNVATSAGTQVTQTTIEQKKTASADNKEPASGGKKEGAPAGAGKQGPDEQEQGKQESSADEQNAKAKGKVNKKAKHDQGNPDTRTDSQKKGSNENANVPSAGSKDKKIDEGEARKTKKEQKSISARSLATMDEEVTRTFSRRDVPTADIQDDKNSDEGNEHEKENQNAPSTTKHKGSKTKKKRADAQKRTETTNDANGVVNNINPEDTEGAPSTNEQGPPSTTQQQEPTAGTKTLPSSDNKVTSNTVPSSGRQEPAKQEPATPETAKPEPAKQEHAKQEPAKPEPAKPEPAKPEPAKQEPAKPEPAKQEHAKQEPDKPEPAKPEPAKPESAKPEPAKPEPGKQETGKQDFENNGKDVKTTYTQTSPKSDNQPAVGVDNKGFPNVAEQNAAPPEVKESPVLGRPWVSRADLFDVPNDDNQQVLYSGDRSWKQYYTTVTNTKYIKYARVANLMDNNEKKIIHSFKRRAFVVINRGAESMTEVPLETELPAGLYCDVVTGTPAMDVNCTGKEILIDRRAIGRFTLEKNSANDMIIVRPQNRKDYNLKYLYIPEADPKKWREVYKTVKFSILDQTDRFYNDIPDDQYAMEKGKKGFMIFKTKRGEMVDVPVQTGLPPGRYCDMISGSLSPEGACSGKNITVDRYGAAKFTLSRKDKIFVTHEGAMIENLPRDFLTIMPSIED